MSTNVDTRLSKSNDTSTGMSLKSALGLDQEQEQSRLASMNKTATSNYLSSLRREQDEVGDNLSRSMNKLNQSLSHAALQDEPNNIDEQAQKMAVYSKLAGKLIDRDSSLQEKVAQNLSHNSNIVRTKDASESFQKAMDNLPPALKEGTQAGKDLAKFMVENLVTISDRKQMGAGLERDLAVRQINIPKNQPNSRVQQASLKVLSASIEYIKSNQPEVLAKISNTNKSTSNINEPGVNSSNQAKAASHEPVATSENNKDNTYIAALKAQRMQSTQGNTINEANKNQNPQDKISAEISKRIHSLIAQAATSAKNGNLISLSPEEAEHFDRTQNQAKSPQSLDNLNRILGTQSSNSSSSANGADGELPPPSSKEQSVAKLRQLSLSELAARANQLQTQFRAERQRIVKEGKLPDPAQMPEFKFDKSAIKTDAPQIQIENQKQQARDKHTASLHESLARARSALSAHILSSNSANQTIDKTNGQESKVIAQEGKAPISQKLVQEQGAEPKVVAADNKAQIASKAANEPSAEPKLVAADNKAQIASKATQEPSAEPKLVAADNKAQIASKAANEQSYEPKVVAEDNKLSVNLKTTTLDNAQNLLNLGKTDVTLSFNAIQSSNYGGMDIMPGMTIPISHFGQLDNDTIHPNNKALEALKVQARLLESQLKSAQSEIAQLKQNNTIESKQSTVANATNMDSDEANIKQPIVQRPSIVPSNEVPKGPIATNEVPKGPIATNDGHEANIKQPIVQRPSIVPSNEVPKGPIVTNDGHEAIDKPIAPKPSIVPSNEVPKGPIATNDGHEAIDKPIAQKPSIVPSNEVPKGPIVNDESNEAIDKPIAQKPSIVPSNEVPKGPIATHENHEAVIANNQNNNIVANSTNAQSISLPESSNKASPLAKLYGAMQEGNYDAANLQKPTLTDKSTNANNLGFNSELAKPMSSSSASLATSNSQVLPSTNASLSPIDGDSQEIAPLDPKLSNNTIVTKGSLEADETIIVDKNQITNSASATDVAKTKEFLAQNAQEAQEKQAIAQNKKEHKEAVAQNVQENKQEQKAQEEQAVQEEFIAAMQARAQSTQKAIEQAQIQANLKAQQNQNTNQLANGKLYENGQINQFSRLYQNSISEQNANVARVLGSDQINTVGDTNIKATGATIATTTTNIDVETQEQNKANTLTSPLAKDLAIKEQASKANSQLSSTATTNQPSTTLAQGSATQNTATSIGAGAQNVATQSAPNQAQAQSQSQAQSQVQAQVQSQAPAQNQPIVQNQASSPNAQGNATIPSQNTNAQAHVPNNAVGSISSTSAIAQAQAQAQAQIQAQAQGQNNSTIQMPNGMSTPVIKLDEDSLQDEIIKNVIQTVPSDDLDEFGIKNNHITSAPLSGVVADTDLTDDNNSISQILSKGENTPNALSALGDSSNIVHSNTTLGAAQITTGQSDPIPEESVVNTIATPKEGGLLRRLASLFGRKSDSQTTASQDAEDKSVDPSKAALDNLLNKGEKLAQSQNSAAINIRTNSYESLVNKLQMAASDEALPPKMQEQARDLLKSLQNPVNDLRTVSSWLNFVTGPMSPSSSQALALHQWAFMLLCIRFEQIGKNVEKFLKKTQGGSDKIAKLETAIKDSAKVAQELDEVSISKSHDLLKETFGQVERMQQQMQSIPQDQSVLRYIPLPPNYQGGKEGSFSAQKRKDEDGGTSWHLNFNLDLQDMGALQIKVKLRFPEIQMSFVAEKFETLQKVQQHMPELNAKLKEIGLTSTGSNARLGHINFNKEPTPVDSTNQSRFKYEGNAFNVDA